DPSVALWCSDHEGVSYRKHRSSAHATQVCDLANQFGVFWITRVDDMDPRVGPSDENDATLPGDAPDCLREITVVDPIDDDFAHPNGIAHVRDVPKIDAMSLNCGGVELVAVLGEANLMTFGFAAAVATAIGASNSGELLRRAGV